MCTRQSILTYCSLGRCIDSSVSSASIRLNILLCIDDMNHHMTISLITIAVMNHHMIGIELKKPEGFIDMGGMVADSPARNSEL